MTENLHYFVKRITQEPAPTPKVIDGKIVDGLNPRRWLVREIAAEAFNQGVLDVDKVSWNEALEMVRQEMNV